MTASEPLFHFQKSNNSAEKPSEAKGRGALYSGYAGSLFIILITFLLAPGAQKPWDNLDLKNRRTPIFAGDDCARPGGDWVSRLLFGDYSKLLRLFPSLDGEDRFLTDG